MRTLASSSSLTVPGGSITQAMLAKPSVGTPELIDQAVTLARLASNSVDSSKIVDGSISATDINASAGILGTQLAAAAGILGTQLAANAGIIGTQLAAAAGILGTQLAAAAGILGTQLASNAALQGTQLAANAGILSSQLAGYGGYPLGLITIPATTLQSFTGIPGTYRTLVLVLSNIRSSSAVANDPLIMRLNSVSTVNYGYRVSILAATYSEINSGAGLGYGLIGQPPGASSSVANVHAHYLVVIPNYIEAANPHGVIASGSSLYGTLPGQEQAGIVMTVTGAITGVSFNFFSGAAFNGSVGGSIRLYGLE